MEFEGRRYTGMKIGRGYKWYYDQGLWKEPVSGPFMGEEGKFEITTPLGIRFTLTAIHGYSIANLCVTTEAGAEQMIWIKKVADFQGHPVPQFKSQVA